MDTKNHTFQQFTEFAVKEENVLEKIRASKSINDVLLIAKNNGFSVTKNDVTSFMNSMQNEMDEPTEDELETVNMQIEGSATQTATCASSCGCNSTETCSNCCRRVWN